MGHWASGRTLDFFRLTWNKELKVLVDDICLVIVGKLQCICDVILFYSSLRQHLVLIVLSFKHQLLSLDQNIPTMLVNRAE